MGNTLVLGLGGVGSVIANKVVENNDVFRDVILSCRSSNRGIRLIEKLKNKRKSNRYKVDFMPCDALDKSRLVDLIKKTNTDMVINAALPDTHLTVMRACLDTGADYIDTAVYEDPKDKEIIPPWYESYEWKLSKDFEDRNLTALLSMGFDPGVVNVFCAKAEQDFFDTIDTIDILDVNAGNHGKFFATNFNPEVNLNELNEPVFYWDNGGWKAIAPFSRTASFVFPEVGEHQLFSVGHDEIHSLYKYISAKKIEFWMGFNERFVNTFSILENLNLLSKDPVNIDGARVAPLTVLSAVLPSPESLAPHYTGKICIGCLISGLKSGIRKTIFIYSTLDHEFCFEDAGAQAISYSTGVPAVAGAKLVKTGIWNVGKMVNPEQLPPDPLLEEMNAMGIQWAVKEMPNDIFVPYNIENSEC